MCGSGLELVGKADKVWAVWRGEMQPGGCSSLYLRRANIYLGTNKVGKYRWRAWTRVNGHRENQGLLS